MWNVAKLIDKRKCIALSIYIRKGKKKVWKPISKVSKVRS